MTWQEIQVLKFPTQYTSRRAENSKKSRSEMKFSVQRADLCGSKTWPFPLIWDSSCSLVSQPALHTLNHSDIYADKKNIHGSPFLPLLFLFQVMLFYFLSLFLSFHQSQSFTITRGVQGACRGRLSTLLTSSDSCFPFSTSLHPSTPTSSFCF